MTPQEHLLMMTLFAHQNFKFNMLFDALTAAGVLQQDDLLAYRELAIEQKPNEIAEGIQKAWQLYQSSAARLGVTTGLADSPAPPK